MQEAHKGSTKLQKQLVQKDMDLESVREELAHAQQELTQAVNGKDEALRVMFMTCNSCFKQLWLPCPAHCVGTTKHQLVWLLPYWLSPG